MEKHSPLPTKLVTANPTASAIIGQAVQMTYAAGDLLSKIPHVGDTRVAMCAEKLATQLMNTAYDMLASVKEGK